MTPHQFKVIILTILGLVAGYSFGGHIGLGIASAILFLILL